MGRAFLSHSSKDKDYVVQVAELFGKDRCVYDNMSFEHGMMTIDEIFRNIDISDIFVYFISNDSLNSEWVGKELNYAQKKLNSDKLCQIYPIIIDENVKYDDSRIPSFLKTGNTSYILKHLLYPRIAYKKINTQLIKLQMNRDADYQKKKNFFYGRDIQIKAFRDRYNDHTKKQARCLIISGIEGIGRQSYIRKILEETYIIKHYYYPEIVYINKNESIIDLIIKISDLGFGNYSLEEITSLSHDNKIEILASLFVKIQELKEHVIIYDNLCLINIQREIAYWFERAVSKINNEIAVSIITHITIDNYRLRNKDHFFAVSLQEMDKKDTFGMLHAYSELKGMLLSREDVGELQGVLTGYPPQTIYCVDLANENGIEYIHENPHVLIDFSSKKVSTNLDLIIKPKQKEISLQTLSFLSHFELLPIKNLYEIYKLNAIYKDIINNFLMTTVCSYSGTSKDYIKVHSVVQDYILRQKIDFPKDIEKFLNDKITDFDRNNEKKVYIEQLDFAELGYYIKENLKKGKKVPEKFLYSTVFLRSIIELYNERQYRKVVDIMKNLKQGEMFKVYDRYPKEQMQFYYCMALARLKNNQFLEEISFFNENRHYGSYYFLLGFYNRMLGKLEEAESNLHKVIDIEPSHYRASRELVAVYRFMEDYESALKLSELNFKSQPENKYNIQAYFECLITINKDILSNKQHDDIKNMMETIENSLDKDEIYYQLSAQYEGYFNSNDERAVNILKEGIRKLHDCVHLSRCLFDIYEKHLNIDGMKETLEKLKNVEGFEYSYLYRKFICDLHYNTNKATLKLDIDRSKLPKRMKQKLLHRLR